jgi:hypothetical protein
LKRQYGDRLAVVALAVESPDDQVRTTITAVGGGIRWAIADATAARAFGDITSVPTLFLFDAAGRCVRTLYGAPPDLHDQVGRALSGLQ